MEPLTTVAAVIAAIKTANDAFATINKAKGNVTTILKGASQFLEAKAQVDVRAAEDKANGQTSTEAFVASIELKRRQKELDEFFTYECEGWVAADWQKHKKAMLDRVASETAPSRKKIRKKQQRDDDVKNVIIAFTILAGLVTAGCVAAVVFGIV